MHFAVLAGLAVLIIILTLMLRGQTRRQAAPAAPRENTRRQLSLRSCLLCGGQMKEGEAMRTSLYPEDGREGRLLEIHGCSRCEVPDGSLPAGKSPAGRKCPLCGSALKPGEPLIARRFETPGKNKVTVMGCSRCYRRGN